MNTPTPSNIRPVGAEPARAWKLKRSFALISAIQSFAEVGLSIDNNWFIELGTLLSELFPPEKKP